MQFAKALVAMAVCVAMTASPALALAQTDTRHAHRDVESVRASPPHRVLREGAGEEGQAPTPNLQGAAQDNNNPLKRRDPSESAARRVYDPVSGLFCELVGECAPCPMSEKDELSCRETGYRQELDCPRAKDPSADELLTKPEDTRETRFKVCTPMETTAPALAVVKFEMLMLVALVASFALLRRERSKHMSSFDMRKDPRQRSGLLGGGGASTSSDKTSD